MIPALPPRRRRIRAFALPLVAAAACAGGLGYLATIWPAPEPFPTPKTDPASAVAIVPMSGDSAYITGTEDEACLGLLDDWVHRPNWQVTLQWAANSCTSEWSNGSITVDADGDALWSVPGMPDRILHLSPKQIMAMHDAAPLSCAFTGEVGYGSDWFEVHWGGPHAPGQDVRESAAHAQLRRFFDDAISGYRARRLAERSDFHARITVPAYAVDFIERPMQITVDARGMVEARIGRKRVTAGLLEPADLVDLIDWVELGHPEGGRIPAGLRQALNRATYDAGWQR